METKNEVGAGGVEIRITGKRQALNVWTLAVATVEGRDYKIEMMRFDEPSRYGIGGDGRISKLYITDDGGKMLADYDRGWYIHPATAAAKAIAAAVTAKYN